MKRELSNFQKLNCDKSVSSVARIDTLTSSWNEFEVHFQGKSRPFLAGDYFCWVTNHVHLHWLVHELLYCTRSFSVPSRWWFKIIEKCFLAKKTWNFAIFGRFWWDLIWQYWVYESQIHCNAKNYSFFSIRNLFQSTRLYIKGILTVHQQFCAW